MIVRTMIVRRTRRKRKEKKERRSFKERGLTVEIAWKTGRRVEIRVPCSSVCLGVLNKCKSSAVISRRSFTAGHGETEYSDAYTSFDFTFRQRVFLQATRRGLLTFYLLPAPFKPEPFTNQSLSQSLYFSSLTRVTVKKHNCANDNVKFKMT